MFADALRCAIEGAPRTKLIELTALMWGAYAATQITETEASDLSNLIELRKVVPETAKEPRKRQGSQPRTPESRDRRRRLAASGRFPASLANHFSQGEAAVMAVLAIEVVEKQDCRLCIDKIAALAGVCRTTVKNALRLAQKLKLITIEERRQTFWRNLTNIVRIVSREWQAWNRLARRPYHLQGGGKISTGTNTLKERSSETGARETLKGYRKDQGKPGSGVPPDTPPSKSVGSSD